MNFAQDNFASDHGNFDLVNINNQAVFSYVNGALQIDKTGAVSGSWDETGIVEKTPRILEIGDRHIVEVRLLTYTNLGPSDATSTFLKIGLQLDKDNGLEREYYGCYVGSLPYYDNGGNTSNPKDPVDTSRRYRLVTDVQADSSLAVWFIPVGESPSAHYLGSVAAPLIGRSARLCVNLYSKDKIRLYNYRGHDMFGA